MDYKQLAQQILQSVGGEQNVDSLTHCMTRLRFVLKDNQAVHADELNSLAGVIGTNRQGEQFQVIIGNDVVKVYNELHAIGNIGQVTGDAVEKEKQHPFSAVIEFISGCVSPLFPALIASGLIKVLLLVLSPSVLNLMESTSDTYVILNALGDAVFYFLPILVAVTAAQRLKTNMYMSVTIVSLLIYPSLIALLSGDKATYLFGFIPVVHASYASSLVPAMLSTVLLKYVDLGVDKVTPNWSKNFLKPFLTLFITGLTTLVVLAPLGSIIGQWVMLALNAIYNFSPWLAMALFAAAMPFIVMTGMHWAFVPATLMALGDGGVGYDLMLLPAMLSSNVAQAGASFGVFFKTKNKDLKGMAIPAAVSALLAGVTEPALYGITLKLKKPLYAAYIASGIGGFVTGLFQLKAYSFASPSLLAILQFIAPDGGNNFIIAWIVFAIAFFGSLILSYILTDKGEASKETVLATEDLLSVYNPIAGNTIALSEVADATFASGVLGKGYAIEPENGVVVAPFSGRVDVLMDSYHAIGLVSDSGVNILVHVGLDTVNLGGQHFSPKVKQGDRVEFGQVLLEFDKSAIQAAGYSTVTPVIVTNSDDYADVKLAPLGQYMITEKMITLSK